MLSPRIKMQRSLIGSLVAAAVMAPSSHNAQPWRFQLRGQAIDLLADRTRALPVGDPYGREMFIACGAALMNLRVAAAALDVANEVQLLPDAHSPDWLARIEFRAGAQPQPEAALAEAIARRRTYRERFAQMPVAGSAIEALVAASASEGATLHLLAAPATRDLLAHLITQADALLWANPSWRAEQAAWMHASRDGDGLPVSSFTLPLAQMVVRGVDLGSS